MPCSQRPDSESCPQSNSCAYPRILFMNHFNTVPLPTLTRILLGNEEGKNMVSEMYCTRSNTKTYTMMINRFNMNNADEGSWKPERYRINCTCRFQQQTTTSKHASNIATIMQVSWSCKNNHGPFLPHFIPSFLARLHLVFHLSRISLCIQST